MKIIHINNVANVPSTLKYGLETLGCAVELYEPSTGGSHRTKLARIVLAIKRLREIFSLIKRLRSGGYDVIHIHYGYYGLISLLARKPYYLHCHGTDVRRNLYKFPYSFPTKVAIKKAKKVFYSTPDLKEHVVKIRNDAVFIPNPIRTDLFDRAKVDNLHAQQNNALRIFILSRLEPIKGTDIAITAAKTLKSELSTTDNAVTPIQILAIDWGVDARKYRNDQMISLIQKCSYENMPALLADSDIAIGQLHLGILSMAELEAMSMELPVIAYFKYLDAYSVQPPVVAAGSAGKDKRIEPVASGSAEPDQPDVINESSFKPTVDDVVLSLRNLTTMDKDARQNIGTSSRDWVIRNHDAVVVSKKVLSEYLNS